MSSDKSEEDEHEVISKQIIDYYRKYSQSKQLPKYLSGSSLSYMPPIVKEDKVGGNSGSAVIITNTENTLIEKEESVEPKPISPTSSVTSNRKLEWDNGADIGYNNCVTKLHKSLSLPILFDTKSVDKKNTSKLSSQLVTVISYPTNSDTPISSSSSPCSAEIPIESSSSFKTNTKPMSVSSSSSTNISIFLKNKIGSPEAESTPKVLLLPKVKVNSKKVCLCITTPIIVECFGYQKKKGSDKKIQTSFVEVLSRSIQTDTGLQKLQPDLTSLQKKQKDNQSIIFVNHDSDTEKQTCSLNIQIDTGMIASQCDSFEYYKDEIQQKLNIDSGSSKEIPLLGLFMTQKQSKSLIGDVDRSIELLQKLLKSKKYDPATKKHYIKKIVDKIVNNKYSEDSTTSSELFIPKRQNDDMIKPTFKKNIPFSPKFTAKTFNEQFLPSNDTSSQSKKRSIFTMSRENKNDTVTSSEKQPVMSSESYPSWKEDKTTSEKLLEQKQKGQGDQLVQFAKKEREHQITWINDEICHLTKLKGLLEKQRTATVYMVSHHFDQYSNSGSHPTSRNYVIETEISSTSSGNVPVEYTFNDKSENKSYTVEEVSTRPEINVNRKVVGNIEVVSDDKTTNIKVKTKKLDLHNTEGFKPKPPTLVGIGKYDTFPKSKTEERCWPCGRMKMNGLCNKRHYSFEVPLNHRTSFVDKINDIINKYTTGSSTDKFSHCCKCTEVFKINDNTSSRWSCECKGQQHVGTEKCVCDTTKDTTKHICSICRECKINKPETASTSEYLCRCKCKKRKDFSDTTDKNSTNFCSCKCKICKGCTVEAEHHEQTCHYLKRENTHDNKLQKADAEVQPKFCKCCKYRDRKGQSDTSEKSSIKSYNRRSKIYEGGTTDIEHKKQTCHCCAFENTHDSNLQKESAKNQTDLCKCDRIKRLCECKCKDQKHYSDTSEKNSLKSCNCKCKIYEENAIETGLKQSCHCCECEKTLDYKLQKESADSQTDHCKCDKETQVCHCNGNCNTKDKSSQKEYRARTCCCCTCQSTKEKDSLEKDTRGSYSQREESSSQSQKETKLENLNKINHENKPTRYVQRLSNESEKQKSTNSEEGSDHSNFQSSFSSSSATDFHSQNDTLKSCLCCKQKNVTSKLLNRLKNKLCDEAYPLCQPCYRQNCMGVYTVNCYRNPTHICNCYTVVQTKTLEAIKGTINDLRELDEYCTCINANNENSLDYCKHCKCKLKKASKNKNGIAYMLTIENGPYDEEIKKKKSDEPYLEEIKIKIPHKKKHKDKENHKKKKKNYDDEERGMGTLGETFPVYSLQEHLSKNRPEFITKAEGRRNTVNQSRSQREEMSDCNKLQFLKQFQEKNERIPDLTRLFSFKEMKEITRRNYKKLPEVQQKLINNRDKQLRQATRLMVDTFNRKLRQSVLKGKKSLPTNVNVTDM